MAKNILIVPNRSDSNSTPYINFENATIIAVEVLSGATVDFGVSSVTPTPTPSITASQTPTRTPAATPTQTGTPAVTPTQTGTLVVTPTPTQTPTSTNSVCNFYYSNIYDDTCALVYSNVIVAPNNTPILNYYYRGSNLGDGTIVQFLTQTCNMATYFTTVTEPGSFSCPPA
jgi:hypothetical protein